MTAIESLLRSTLLRTLQSENGITRAEAISRVVAAAPVVVGMELDTASRASLDAMALTATEHGILNPNWSPAGTQLRYHYYLVDAQAGWLPLLIAQTRASSGLSHYILYGHWDSLIVMHGTDERATKLLSSMQEMGYFALEAFAAARFLFFCRRPVPDLGRASKPVVAATVNELIDQYDLPGREADRAALAASGVLLGSSWRIDGSNAGDLDAFIGVSVRGGGVSGPEILEALLRDDVVRSCLVHFVEIERGIPFHYVAFITCRDLVELDHVTDYMSFLKIGRVSLETETYVVAQGTSGLLRIDNQTEPGLSQAPDFGRAEEVGMATLLNLGAGAIESFNALDGPSQLAVLSSFDDIREQLAMRDWDDERHNRILGAERMFIAVALGDLTPAEVEAPALAISNAVESASRLALTSLIRGVYGRDLGRAQNELHLPTRDIAKIGMGKAVVILRTMRESPAYAKAVGQLEESWLLRLQSFAEGRNRWHHAVGPSDGSPKEVIAGLSRFLVEGIKLVRWLTAVRFSGDPGQDSSLVEPSGPPEGSPSAPLDIAPARDRSGTFLSYSSVDVEIATRIASGLRVLDPPLWFDKWSIEPSESIVERINDGLARSDTLVVLLTPSSVESRWVQRELDAALMNQLKGVDVAIVPALVEDCAIPPVLLSIEYIDMRGGRFYEGFVELMEFIKRRADR